jgi:hypothetical protein
MMCGEEFWAHRLDERDRGKVKQESLSKECSVQRDSLAVRIADHQLLRTRCERGSSHRRRVRVLERDTRGLPANGNFGSRLEAAATQRDAGAAGCGPDAGDSVPIPKGRSPTGSRSSRKS